MKSPFELLGLEPSFALSDSVLNQRQKELSLHRLLKNPVQRGEALLNSLGVSTEEATEPQADPAFLMEIMEARESLRQWGKDEDVTKIEAAIKSFTQRQSEALSQVAELFEQLEVESSEQVLKVRAALAPLRYFRRYFDEANAYLDELI